MGSGTMTFVVVCLQMIVLLVTFHSSADVGNTNILASRPAVLYYGISELKYLELLRFSLGSALKVCEGVQHDVVIFVVPEIFNLTVQWVELLKRNHSVSLQSTPMKKNIFVHSVRNCTCAFNKSFEGFYLKLCYYDWPLALSYSYVLYTDVDVLHNRQCIFDQIRDADVVDNNYYVVPTCIKHVCNENVSCHSSPWFSVKGYYTQQQIELFKSRSLGCFVSGHFIFRATPTMLAHHESMCKWVRQLKQSNVGLDALLYDQGIMNSYVNSRFLANYTLLNEKNVKLNAGLFSFNMGHDNSIFEPEIFTENYAESLLHFYGRAGQVGWKMKRLRAYFKKLEQSGSRRQLEQYQRHDEE